MAEVVGINGIRIETPEEVDRGIAAALAHDGLALADAVVARTELPIPPTITAEMARGFTLYMLKAVLNRRRDELLDLARTNLWHPTQVCAGSGGEPQLPGSPRRLAS